MPSLNARSFVKKYNNIIISVRNQFFPRETVSQSFQELRNNNKLRICLCLYPQNVEVDRRESRPSFETDIVSSNSSVYTPRLENERVLPCSIREINPDIKLISVG